MICLNILFDVLMVTAQLMSPVTPFLSEHIYQNLRNGLMDESQLKAESIHFTLLPLHSDSLINKNDEAVIERM